ncbi:MAG: endonuclease [Bacteroidales bacterium]|nr:endonuclease [Bacteroidales bacterium]
MGKNFSIHQRKTQALLLIFLFLSPAIFGQNKSSEEESTPQNFRLMFYNVENYFDVLDDSLSNDEEFTPHGIRNWNYKRFLEKRNHIYKTIMAVGSWEPPAIIGLAEVENRFVLKQLAYKTPFAKYDYRILHEDSPDRRGIDVALLFNPKIIQVLNHELIRIRFPFAPEIKTRDILYVHALAYNQDTLHIFVNHWPSRYGGELASEPKRLYVAQQLANKIDELKKINPNAAIVVMGDFNDYPSNKSIKEVLNAGKDPHTCRLINMMTEDNRAIGTNKFKGEWGILDQIMVSPVLFLQDKSIFVIGEAQIFNADFLLEKDDHFLGNMPFRTYKGMKYHRGFSDHLPIYVDFVKKMVNTTTR